MIGVGGCGERCLCRFWDCYGRCSCCERGRRLRLTAWSAACDWRWETVIGSGEMGDISAVMGHCSLTWGDGVDTIIYNVYHGRVVIVVGFLRPTGSR